VRDSRAGKRTAGGEHARVGFNRRDRSTKMNG
jgi:hypothetical protein